MHITHESRGFDHWVFEPSFPSILLPYYPVIGVNHTGIYNMFSMCLCNLNARFTHIFLNIILIPHLLRFCTIKRQIKQGKGKKLRRKNLLFEALVHRGEEVRQVEDCFTTMKSKP